MTSNSNLRQAVPEDILQAAKQIDVLQDWQRVLNFARSVYGPSVYKAVLKLETDGNWQNLVEIDAFDKEGQPLCYSFDLPFWKQTHYSGKTYLQEIEEQTASSMESLEKYSKVTDDVYMVEHTRAHTYALREMIYRKLPKLSTWDVSEFCMDQLPLVHGERLVVCYRQEDMPIVAEQPPSDGEHGDSGICADPRGNILETDVQS